MLSFSATSFFVIIRLI